MWDVDMGEAYYCSHNDAHPEWVTGIAVCQMDDSHLHNALAWIDRKIAEVSPSYYMADERDYFLDEAADYREGLLHEIERRREWAVPWNL